METKWLAALAVAAAVLVGAGCGDDDDAVDAAEETPVEEEAIEEAAFVEQANALCAETDAEIRSLDLPDTTPEAVVFNREEAFPRYRDVLAEVRALGYPDGRGDELEGLITSAEDRIDELDARLEEALQTPEDPFADISAEMQRAGLDECKF